MTLSIDCRRAAASLAFGLVFAAGAVPGAANAAECGPGTVYDAATDLCVQAAPPPPPPVWNGDPTPGFSVGFCLPIPFVAVCFGT